MINYSWTKRGPYKRALLYYPYINVHLSQNRLIQYNSSAPSLFSQTDQQASEGGVASGRADDPAADALGHRRRLRLLRRRHRRKGLYLIIIN